MKEISSIEINESKSKDVDNYKSINPDSNMSVSDAKAFWDDEFSEDSEQSDINNIKEFSSFDEMKESMGLTRQEINELKPPHSNNLGKWYDAGGKIRIETTDGKNTWTFIDSEGREVKYVDGYPKFPDEAKHPVIKDIYIGEFTGDRDADKELYLKALEEKYGLTEIPEGYSLHHDSENGVLQLVKTEWHEEFRHQGGHSKYKEGD